MQDHKASAADTASINADQLQAEAQALAAAKPVDHLDKAESASLDAKTNPECQDSEVQKQIKVLNQKLKSQHRGNSLLWILVLLLIIASGSSFWYTHQQELRFNQAQQEADSQFAKAQSLIQQINQTKPDDSAVKAAAAAGSAAQQAMDAYDQLAKDVAALKAQQSRYQSELSNADAQLQRYADRNPNDWRLAESYFLISNAYEKAIFDHAPDAALWLLNEADLLLKNINEDAVIKVREAIASDLSQLRAQPQLDVTGIKIKLEQLYQDTDKLVAKGSSDVKRFEQAIKADTAPSADASQWQENLLTSAKEFSSRFIEVRRRDAADTPEFLTPAQDLYVRENIKTRLLMAKAALAGRDGAAFSADLNAALTLVKTHFDQSSPAVIAMRQGIEELAQLKVSRGDLRTLQSLGLIQNLAAARLMRQE